ncbi:MAG: hypothetical protein EAZ53_04550 [Bacteroidetes bacterium]|nr:MAG: hypothetical protein EAZ53_04550 [Bacteroidota bacterium]
MKIYFNSASKWLILVPIGFILFLTACPTKEQIKPQVKVENPKPDENSNTISGTNTTTGTTTIIGVETPTPEEEYRCDTLLYGKPKPLFYADFDTSKKSNDIQLHTFDDFFNLPPNHKIECNVGIINNDILFKNNCFYRTCTGANCASNLTLPSIDFNLHTIIKLEYIHADCYGGPIIKFKLNETKSNYNFEYYFTDTGECFSCLVYGSKYYQAIANSKLDINKKIIPISLRRSQCIVNGDCSAYNPQKEDTLSITEYPNL